ncbi:SGNH/GDSL hydrolase family protein [Planctomycetota bacterium]
MQRSIRNAFVLAGVSLMTIGSALTAEEPRWIWGSENAQQEASEGECEFRRKFTLVKKIKPPAKSDGPFELRDGDRVVLLGNTFIERAQRYGFIECELTRLCPNRNVIFRNLGWSGDTVFGEARARFGTAREGFEHLETQVHLVDPTLILSAYGSNAAFAGRSGIAPFIAGYEKLLNVLEATGARITLLSPMKHEDLGPPLPDHAKYNQNLALYRDAIRNLAKRRSLGFVDLHDAYDNVDVESESLTDNGIHLTESGYRFAATTLSDRLEISTDRPVITIDAASAMPKTKAATVSGVSSKSGSLTFRAKLDTLPLPTHPDGAPTTAFQLKVRNLPDGNYKITADDEILAVANAAKLEAGVSIIRGPDVAQVDLLRQTICRKNELFFHRWRPQNETYLFLFRKHEQGNNAVEIPKFDPLVAEQEAIIVDLRVPKTHSYAIRRK